MPRGILLCEKHLRHGTPVLMEKLLVDMEQRPLSDRGERLTCRNTLRTLFHADRRHTRRNRARRDEQNILSLICFVDQLADKMLDAAQVHPACRMREGARPHLDDNAFRFAQTRTRAHSSILG